MWLRLSAAATSGIWGFNFVLGVASREECDAFLIAVMGFAFVAGFGARGSRRSTCVLAWAPLLLRARVGKCDGLWRVVGVRREVGEGKKKGEAKRGTNLRVRCELQPHRYLGPFAVSRHLGRTRVGNLWLRGPIPKPFGHDANS